MMMVGTAFQSIGLGFPSVCGRRAAPSPRPRRADHRRRRRPDGARRPRVGRARRGRPRHRRRVERRRVQRGDQPVRAEGSGPGADAHPGGRLRRRRRRVGAEGVVVRSRRGPRRARRSWAAADPAARARSCCSTCRISGAVIAPYQQEIIRANRRAVPPRTHRIRFQIRHESKGARSDSIGRMPTPADPRFARASRRPARARSSRSTSATRPAPTSAAGGPRPRPTSSSRRARWRRPAARSSGPPAPSCSPSRARSRSSSAPPPGACALDRGVGPRRLGHRRERLRPVRPARERQGLERAVQGRRRLHADRPGAASTPATVDPAALRVRAWVNGELAPGRHDRRAALPARPARRRPLAALHARAGRRDPHRHPGRLLASSCPATSSRSRSTRPTPGADAPGGSSPR